MAVLDVVKVYTEAGDFVTGTIRAQYDEDGEATAVDNDVVTALVYVSGGAGGSGGAQRVLVKGTDPGEFDFTDVNS